MTTGGNTLPNLVCYCFGFTDEDIEADVIANNGRSLIREKIIAAKRSGGCRCGELHPEGR
jgi:hypothetical protein